MNLFCLMQTCIDCSIFDVSIIYILFLAVNNLKIPRCLLFVFDALLSTFYVAILIVGGYGRERRTAIVRLNRTIAFIMTEDAVEAIDNFKEGDVNHVQIVSDRVGLHVLYTACCSVRLLAFCFYSSMLFLFGV